MIEWHLLAGKIPRSDRRLINQTFPAAPTTGGRRLPALRGVRHMNRMLDAIQSFEDGAQFGAAVVVLAAVLILIDVKKDPGRQLPETLQPPFGAEVGAAAAPDGADAGRGEHGDCCLRRIR